MTVPDDLRNILETCLAEDAVPANLERFLPDVRKIITNLLQGLRGKQSIYRKIVSEHRHRSESTGHSRQDSHASMRSVSDRPRRDTSGSGRTMNARNNGEHQRISDSQSLRRTATTSGRRKDSGLMQSVGSPPRPPLVEDEDGGFVGGFMAPDSQPLIDPAFIPPDQMNGFSPPDRASTPPRTRSYTGEPVSPERAKSPSGSYRAPPLPIAAPVPTQPQVPASVKRYSLVDKPLSVPSVVIDDASPSPPFERGPERSFSPDLPSPLQSPPIEMTSTPAIASSLAALQKSDVLERRASKRFSVYNIAKMTNMRAPSSSGAHRRSMAGSNSLTNGELATLTEADEEPVAPRKQRSARRMHTPATITENDETPPPVPSLPAKDILAPESQTEESVISISPGSATNSFTVFLQVGREVKKATIDPPLTLSTLRMMFVDKFSYSPGLGNFPSIYIRDASSGIQYELEDVDEVRDKCLLSLNIEREHTNSRWRRVVLKLCLSFGPDQATHRHPNIIIVPGHQRSS